MYKKIFLTEMKPEPHNEKLNCDWGEKILKHSTVTC